MESNYVLATGSAVPYGQFASDYADFCFQKFLDEETNRTKVRLFLYTKASWRLAEADANAQKRGGDTDTEAGGAALAKDPVAIKIQSLPVVHLRNLAGLRLNETNFHRPLQPTYYCTPLSRYQQVFLFF